MVLSLPETEFIINLSRQPVSLDEEFISGDGGFVSRKDFLLSSCPGPEEVFLEKENRQFVESILDRLDERERMIIRLRFGFDALPDWIDPGRVKQSDREVSLADISKIVNLSRERVRQIEIEGMNKIKKFIRKVMRH